MPCKKKKRQNSGKKILNNLHGAGEKENAKCNVLTEQELERIVVFKYTQATPNIGTGWLLKVGY